LEYQFWYNYDTISLILAVLAIFLLLKRMKIMSEIKKGVVVQLKSGSPLMTVLEVDGENVICQWFVKTTVKKGVFNIDTLVIARRGSVTLRAR